MWVITMEIFSNKFGIRLAETHDEAIHVIQNYIDDLNSMLYKFNNKFICVHQDLEELIYENDHHEVIYFRTRLCNTENWTMN